MHQSLQSLQSLKKSPGLLWGVVVRGGQAQHIVDDTAADALAAPHDWCWLHFALSDHRARRFLQAYERAPETARALLLSGDGRPQIQLSDDCAFGVICDIEKSFAGDELGAGRLAFWLDASHLITARHHPMRVVDEVRSEVQGAPPPSPADVFVRLNERYGEVVEQRLGELAHKLDRIEDMVLGEQGRPDQAGLGPVRRELARYHREFGGLRAAYHRALSRGSHPKSPVAPSLPGLLQGAEDFDHDVAALSERARLLYEEMDTRIAAAANRSLQALTVFSTLLLPPTFIAGAFGMNLPSIPWANTHGGFWWAIGLCAVVVGLCWAALRRYRIL
jgi:zinc transporter